MERRNFLTGLAAGTATAGVAATLGTAKQAIAAPAVNKGVREWKMVTTWPKGFPGLGTGAQRAADRITAMSDGRLKVKLYGAGELVGALEIFDAVSGGTAEMGHGASYYWQGKNIATNFFTAVPFGMTANEINAWVKFGGGQELWDELYARFNLKGFQCGNTGVQMGGWFNKEINSMDDMKGLKIRMPGLGGEMMRRIGATAVTLPGGEIFPALQSGTIDATEWVGPWNDLAFGFYKVTKYYYWPGVHEPGSTLEMMVNKEAYDDLPKDLQEIVSASAAAENDIMYAEYNAKNSASLDTLINKHKVNLRQMPDEVIKALGASASEIISELREHDDALVKKITESFLAARKNGMEWSRLSDQGYMNARQLVPNFG